MFKGFPFTDHVDIGPVLKHVVVKIIMISSSAITGEFSISNLSIN